MRAGGVTGHHVFLDGEKRQPILSVELDGMTGIAAGSDMVEGARVEESQRSGHDHRILPKTDNSRPDPFDLFDPFF